MKSNVTNIVPEIHGVTAVFRGARVPIERLFINLEALCNWKNSSTIFIPREQAVAVIDMASKSSFGFFE